MKQEQEEMINEIAELGDSFKQMEKKDHKEGKKQKSTSKIFCSTEVL